MALVRELLSGLAEEQGAIVEGLTTNIDDPAAVVAYAHRHFVRLAAGEPAIGQLLIQLDVSHGLMRGAFGHRAIRDIRQGIRAERFTVDDAVAAAYTSGGALLGTIAGVVDGALTERADEVHAAAVLRLLGLEAADAATLSRLAMD